MAEFVEARPGYHDLVRHDLLHLIPDCSSLLDVGGGFGSTAAHLKRAGRAKRIGVIDQVKTPSDPMIDFARAGDISDCEFVRQVMADEGPFDVVLCLDTLEHLVDPWNLVRILHSGIGPGGHLVVSVPNVRYFKVSMALFFRNRWRLADSGVLDRTHLRFFVRDTAAELATCSGLSLVSVARPLPQRHQRIHALLGHLLGSFLAMQYVVVAKRDT
jgi:2-polyprenyl-3-methyl-5-hydroxy-6-metoxy-1,4-benzoquinol methylase